MAIVLNATWISQPGSEAVVRDALRNLAPASRNEPGNLFYQVYQDPDEPRTFRIFEIYEDDEAVAAHAGSEHFRTWALERAIPLLTERRREFARTLDF